MEPHRLRPINSKVTTEENNDIRACFQEDNSPEMLNLLKARYPQLSKARLRQIRAEVNPWRPERYGKVD